MVIRPGVRRLLRLRRQTIREEVDDEILTHIALRAEQLMRRGLSPEAARAEAERRFGGRSAVYRTAGEKERRLAMREWLDSVRHDAALTLRSFGRYPAFAAAVVGTLALGIGATVTIVTIVDGVLLRPLPYAEPSRLYAVVDVMTNSGDESMSSPLELNELRRRTSAFAGLAGVEHDAVNLTGGGEPEQIAAQRVSADFFEVLGVHPASGSAFRAADGEPAAAPVVLLSHDLWQTRFGGAADIIGRTIQLDGRGTQVVGVMPEGFAFGDFGAKLWLPLQYEATHPGRFLHLVARLADDAAPVRAAAELDAVIAALAAETPLFFRNVALELVPLRARLVGDARPVLLALVGAVTLLLLIACGNVANLLLARALRRRRELAVRLSLGAARWRVIRQLLTESAVLALAGGAAGLIIAALAVRLVVTRLPAAIALPRATELTIDLRVALLALGVTALTTLIFGLAPALIGSRASDHALLLRGGRGNSGSRGAGRLRGALVVAQVALVSVLLLATGLLGRTLWSLQRVDMGMATREIVAATVARADQQYPAGPDARLFFDELLREVSALPGVSAAAMVQHLPLTGERSSTGIAVDGTDRSAGADIRAIGGDFLQATGIPLLAGRAFTPADRAEAPTVFLVNSALARSIGGNAVGRRISYHWGAVIDGKVVPVRITGEIVGVIGDVHESGPAAEPAPALYRPFAQDPWPTMSLVMRSSAASHELASAVTLRIHELHPDQPVTVRPLSDYAATLVARPRMQVFLIGCFASIALLLAGIGLYGVITYMVNDRRQELGIRLAVGATPATLTRLVVRQGLALAATGLITGAVVALLTLPALRSLIFGVRLADPLAIAAAAAFVITTAALASAFPARRAARIDPMTALRED